MGLESVAVGLDFPSCCGTLRVQGEGSRPP